MGAGMFRASQKGARCVGMSGSPRIGQAWSVCGGVGVADRMPRLLRRESLVFTALAAESQLFSIYEQFP